MKVSIITAAKNAARTVGDTLRSVERQDYPHIEHVIVDGCSSDGTLEEVRKHGRRVARVFSERDSGIYEAFNRGLKGSSGDVIAFLNADDIYASNTVVSQVIREFESSAADIVFGDVIIVRADDLDSVVRYYSSAKFMPARLSRGFIPAHPAMFVRREIYARFGGFNSSYRIAGDFEWAARVFCHGGVSYRHLRTVLVRMRAGGVSTSGIGSTLRITRELRRACKEQGITSSYLKLASRFPEKLIEYIRRPRVGSP